VDRLAITLATIVPGLLALAVVVGWVVATITGVGNTADLRDAAIAVLAFYFGGVVHSNGVTSGAAAANGTPA
jgi:uncharacterized membrane protein